MLACVPKVKETYSSMKTLFDLIRVNDILFKFLADFKLLLIVNGLQTSTASYPCPYCRVKLRTLRGKHEPVEAQVGGTYTDIKCGQMRTYGDIRKSYER